ncbi:MAG: hypothetical protein RLZZ163_216, partial [Actinomycetota bacterium]
MTQTFRSGSVIVQVVFAPMG